jgi:hypothetical protein
VLGDLFYQLGTIIGGLGSHLPGKAGAATGHASGDADGREPEGDGASGADTDDASGPAGGVMAGAAAAWLAARVLRPRPVSWPRVVLAGVAATFLADLVERTLDRDQPAGRAGLDGDTEALVRRYGTGIAMAAGYATLLYPRLPGPPLLRGLAFGALDLAAAQRGGLAGLAADTPSIRFPLQTLALPPDRDAGPLAAITFGLALGLFYRYDDGDAEDDADEVDPEP